MERQHGLNKQQRNLFQGHPNMNGEPSPVHGNKLFLISIVFITFLFFLSSCNDIDGKIEDCYNAGDTIINLADLYPEEWDTVYYFTNACSIEDMEKRVGSVIRRLYGDVGDRILILNKNKNPRDYTDLSKVVLYKEYFPNYGQKIEGSIFSFKKRSKILAIPREKAKFVIRKIDNDTFWVIHQDYMNEGPVPHDSI